MEEAKDTAIVVVDKANNELNRMGKEPIDIFNDKVAEDSIRNEPDTDQANSGGLAATESQSVNINVASTSQFGAQEEENKGFRGAAGGGGQNEDLDLSTDVRPKTAPVAAQ